jgi:LemA protein
MTKGFQVAVIVIVLTFLLLCGMVSSVVGVYNGLVVQKESADERWAQVENELKRRADLVPNLVNTVKGSANLERDITDSITSARAKLGGGGLSPKEAATANSELSSAISRLLIVVENYPNIQSTQAFRDLSAQLEGSENRITVARMDYNAEVKKYNTQVKRFPTSFFANIFGFDPLEYFDIEEKDSEVPVVNFDK